MPPKGSDIIFSNIEEFLDAIEEPTEEYIIRSTGKKYYLPEQYIEGINRAKTTITNLVFKTVDEEGLENLSWRLQKSAKRVAELTEIVLHGYGDALNTAVTELGEIIKGSPLTLSEKIDLAEQEEYNQGYEEPY